MRAFEDICVRPSFDDADTNEAGNFGKSLVKGVVVVAAVGTAVAVATGKIPEIPGLDANSVRYVLRLAGLPA